MKEYVIKGKNGFTTYIEVDLFDKDVKIADASSYNPAYVALSQIDELIEALQQIKKEFKYVK
jgi:hypothetical protein